MKQKGKVWYDPTGQQVPSRYLPPYDIATEKAVSAILAMAEHLEKLMHSGKFDADSLSQKTYTEYLKLNKPVTVFSFTNFDRSARVEFDTKNRYVRVYRATKENPTSKDYEMINLNFNAIITTESQGEQQTKLHSHQSLGLSGTEYNQGASGILHQGKDRSLDMPDLSEDRKDNSEMIEMLNAPGALINKGPTSDLASEEVEPVKDMEVNVGFPVNTFTEEPVPVSESK